MDLSFDPEQEELRAVARAFLQEQADPRRVREAMATELGYDPAVWKQIGAELGWTALLVPEAYGGLGLGFVDLIALEEPIGEALLCAPFFSTVCLATNLLLLTGTEAQRRELLPPLAAGELRATLALTEPGGSWDPGSVQTSARREGSDVVLEGVKRYVLDGHCADRLLVVAREAGTSGRDGIGVYVVPAEAKGLERRRLPTLDATRRLAEVVLQGVRVPASARLGDEAPVVEALERALDRAAIALGAEQVGGAERCLELSVGYAKERVQFGRPIGSFQAIQHKCADMMLWVETARSAVYAGACLADEDGEELEEVAPLVKAYASEAYFRCAAEALQIHGGVGFTWEVDVHLYLKRARGDMELLGSPRFHRERIAQRILGPTAESR